jgi:hypothetical protein
MRAMIWGPGITWLKRKNPASQMLANKQPLLSMFETKERNSHLKSHGLDAALFQPVAALMTGSWLIGLT